MRHRNPLEAIARARDEAMAGSAKQACEDDDAYTSALIAANRPARSERRELRPAMTAPDYTTYLAATDLRTPYEVANWIAETGRPLHWAELVRRLDRERRQACRRGALANYRVGAEMLRAFRESTGPVTDTLRRLLAESFALRRIAKAFRAAARAK